MFRVLSAAMILMVSVAFSDEPTPDGLGLDADGNMTAYAQPFGRPEVQLEMKMVPIPGGSFVMGSPETEAKRSADEGPEHEVTIEPFWMGQFEVTWDQFDEFHLAPRTAPGEKRWPYTSKNTPPDGISRPTAQYVAMDYGMGHDGFPVICITNLSAKSFCEWLTVTTGNYYRLPTEAEWEYACRAGTTTAYSWGDDLGLADEYAWFYENSDDQYQKIGSKKPNMWGLYDMHGNVAEWCLDRYDKDFYASKRATQPFPLAAVEPGQRYGHIARGGSWIDDIEGLRSAARLKEDSMWNMQDADLPQSIWWNTDADFVGFRVLRPKRRPSNKEILDHVLYPDIPDWYDVDPG